MGNVAFKMGDHIITTSNYLCDDRITEAICSCKSMSRPNLHDAMSVSLLTAWEMQVMREGTDVTLVAFGKLVGYNLKVAEELEKEGISCEVHNYPPPPPLSSLPLLSLAPQLHSTALSSWSISEGLLPT